MAEVHTKTRRIVDDAGTVLFLETATVLVDGDEVKIDSERRVGRCPTCGSRLDKVETLGQCWECGVPVCTNCGVKAACCKRTVCEKHIHMSLLNNERIPVCSEHAPAITERQRLYDSILLFNQKLKKQEQQHAIELRARDMRLKEAVASVQKVLGSRHQVYQEALSHEKLRMEHARLRIEQFRTLAPNASRILDNYRDGGLHLERR